jgi:hypothetical protein
MTRDGYNATIHGVEGCGSGIAAVEERCDVSRDGEVLIPVSHND